MRAKRLCAHRVKRLIIAFFYSLCVFFFHFSHSLLLSQPRLFLSTSRSLGYRLLSLSTTKRNTNETPFVCAFSFVFSSFFSPESRIHFTPSHAHTLSSHHHLCTPRSLDSKTHRQTCRCVSKSSSSSLFTRHRRHLHPQSSVFFCLSSPL